MTHVWWHKWCSYHFIKWHTVNKIIVCGAMEQLKEQLRIRLGVGMDLELDLFYSFLTRFTFNKNFTSSGIEFLFKLNIHVCTYTGVVYTGIMNHKIWLYESCIMICIMSCEEKTNHLVWHQTWMDSFSLKARMSTQHLLFIDESSIMWLILNQS